MIIQSSPDSSRRYVEKLSRRIEGEFERDFFVRMHGPGPDHYKDRLVALGFKGFDCVLDAGCGYGQWALALSALNRLVVGADISEMRTKVCRTLTRSLGRKPALFAVASLPHSPFPSGSFDAVFCFSVVQYTDAAAAVEEFARLLRPGGQLFIQTSGAGRHLYNFIRNRHAAPDFHARLHAAKSLLGLPGGAKVFTQRGLERLLRGRGFEPVMNRPTYRYGFLDVLETMALKHG